ncbi:MAG TPA: MFS transporter [Gemmatimonadales bacterium]|nr:MFS transporter [Gemmatimonadales bacterium]
MNGASLRTRLTWLGLLSVASGLPYFLFTETVPVFLASRGVSLAEIGLATGASLPWAFKFCWAPLVDRYGSRRAWIRGCLALLALGTLLLGTIDPVARPLAYGIALVSFVVLSATQDIAIDAYTIESTTTRELGVANSVRIAAYRGASFVSSALLVWIAARQGWVSAFGAGAALFGVLALATLPLPVAQEPRTAPPSLLEPLAAFLARRDVWVIILFALLFKLDISAMEPMTKPFWVRSGLTLGEIAALTTARLVATLAGAALGGIIATRVGIFTSLWTLGLVQLLSSLGYATAAALPAHKALIAGAAVFENFAAGLGTAAFLAFLMSVCERRFAATQYALLSALFALSRSGAGLVSGVLAERMGFAHYFLLTFFLGLPAYLLLPRIRRITADK